MEYRFPAAAVATVCMIICSLSDSGFPSTQPMTDIHFDIQADDPGLAHETESILVRSRADAERILGDTVDSKISVYIVNSRERFDMLTRGGLPDWGVGCAIPSKGMIVIISPTAAEYRQPFQEIVRHEWAHIALRQRVGSSYIPRFLDEGFAMYFANQWSNSYAVTLAKAQLLGSLFPLRSIDRVNFFNSSQAQIAYAQSYQAVTYLLTEYGHESFEMILDALRDGLSLDGSFEAAIGADFRTFENEYNLYIQKHYSWLLVFSDMWIMWLVLALLIIIGFILKKKRGRDTIKRWEEEEKYQSTDFDYEEGDPWD